MPTDPYWKGKVYSSLFGCDMEAGFRISGAIWFKLHKQWPTAAEWSLHWIPVPNYDVYELCCPSAEVHNPGGAEPDLDVDVDGFHCWGGPFSGKVIDHPGHNLYAPIFNKMDGTLLSENDPIPTHVDYSEYHYRLETFHASLPFEVTKVKRSWPDGTVTYDYSVTYADFVDKVWIAASEQDNFLAGLKALELLLSYSLGLTGAYSDEDVVEATHTHKTASKGLVIVQGPPDKTACLWCAYGFSEWAEDMDAALNEDLAALEKSHGDSAWAKAVAAEIEQAKKKLKESFNKDIYGEEWDVVSYDEIAPVPDDFYNDDYTPVASNHSFGQAMDISADEQISANLAAIMALYHGGLVTAEQILESLGKVKHQLENLEGADEVAEAEHDAWLKALEESVESGLKGEVP